MSVHMKTPPTKEKKSVLCISEKGQVYKLPQSILNKYVVDDEISYGRAIKIIQKKTQSVSPGSAFAEINAKYTKTGALLKAVRLREGLNQKEFGTLIDVTQGDLSKMEQGKRPIGRKLALRILKKFGSRIS